MNNIPTTAVRMKNTPGCSRGWRAASGPTLLLLAALFACNAQTSGVEGEGSESSSSSEEGGDATCGDGELDADESCDDGNAANGDGCSSTCEVEKFFACGADGIVCDPVRILIGTTGEDDPAVRSAVASVTGGPVDYVDMRTTVLEASELVGEYDCVYVQGADDRGPDEEAASAALLEYSESGGVLVLGYSALQVLDEGIATQEHLPGFLTGVAFDAFYDHDGSDMLFGGVESINYDVFNHFSQFFPGAIEDGTLKGIGNPDAAVTAAAYFEDMRIVLLAGSIMPIMVPPTSVSGDYDVLLANACSAVYRL